MGKTLRTFFSRRMIIVFLMGISSGIPLLAIGSTLQAWMTDEKVDLALIGFFALAKLPYTFKFVWAPLMDRFTPLPFLDRRRGWMLIMQVALAISMAGLGLTSPSESPWIVALIVCLVAFFSASQDIAVDAYRREILTDEELGLGSAMGINGYRIGMLISGALALFLADHVSWRLVYAILGSTFVIGIVTTLLAPSPDIKIRPPSSLREAVVKPFLDYFKRRGAFEILLFVLLYKIGDQMASNMTTPFILSQGFSKTDIAAIAKTFGIFATIGGAVLGGLLILHLGIKKSLWLFGALQAISTLGFSALAYAGQNYAVLTGVIAFENLAAGLGGSAYVAFMASLTNRKFTATQYALLSSLIGIPRDIIAAPTGILAENLGWLNYFLFCTIVALPGLFLLIRYETWQRQSQTEI